MFHRKNLSISGGNLTNLKFVLVTIKKKYNMCYYYFFNNFTKNSFIGNFQNLSRICLETS